ncbi:hypothetical protein OYE22_27365 [Streptomyces sp. 71268]|uniref:hypothetical protein n=1 Tax=Streptomyces sp. 71268 TaxID=3002640 RepID=UPI0023FA1C59|nr:hypothetical protein [Streptomyces sp. 71268]WEV28491.1 hypothetical protein OYE22_27365 [Streptomyces sp. 71268]
MVADALAQAVRQQLGLGRLLPLGTEHDGAWVTEHAATAVLRAAAAEVPEVRVTALHVDLLAPDQAAEPAVPAPPTALRPGPLRVAGEFLAAAEQPLPTSAERLRATLYAAATDRLGLVVGAVDLRVTGLLEEARATEATQPPGGARPADGARPANGAPGDAGPAGAEGRPGTRASAELAPAAARPASEATVEGRVAGAVAEVPGVARLAPALGGLTRPVRVEGPRATAEAEAPVAGASAPARHAQVQVAVAAGHRAVEVARAVRDRARAALLAEAPGPVTVAVLVTAVDAADMALRENTGNARSARSAESAADRA